MTNDELIQESQKNYIDKLAYIYLKDGKVLTTLSRGKDTWYIPGGKREGDESDHEALTREVKEELNVDLVPEAITHYGTFEAQAHGKPAGTVVRMTCYMADFTGELAAASEIEKIDFFSYAQKKRSSPVDLLIFDDLYARGLLT
jgi:8-oxo-dGTP pyrophosphatase MutT (NUDIX family)